MSITKYFLHGGYTSIASQKNTNFFSTLLTAVDKNNINILIIPFARDPSLWAAKCLEVKNKFDEVGDMRKITIHIATNSVEGLINQIFKADILFIWGGNTQLPQSILGQIPEIKNRLQGKIIAGSSAGALMFSEYYYENDSDTYHRGLGLIKCGMICHWKNQVQQKVEIEKVVGFGRVLCIPEGDFIVKEG